MNPEYVKGFFSGTAIATAVYIFYTKRSVQEYNRMVDRANLRIKTLHRSLQDVLLKGDFSRTDPEVIQQIAFDLEFASIATEEN